VAPQVPRQRPDAGRQPGVVLALREALDVPGQPVPPLGDHRRQQSHRRQQLLRRRAVAGQLVEHGLEERPGLAYHRLGHARVLRPEVVRDRPQVLAGPGGDGPGRGGRRAAVRQKLTRGGDEPQPRPIVPPARRPPLPICHTLV
jgi:hypothetical protein